MHIRLRLSSWFRRCPKMALKTVILIVGPLLWLLYLYSTNYIYVIQQKRVQPNAHRQLSTHFPAVDNNEILRRPTVPIFEGVEEAGNANSEINERKYKFKLTRRGDFAVINDAIPRRKQYDSEQSITLTTHATYELLDNVIELSRHWAGPVAVAVYAPNTDFKIAFEFSLWLRGCFPIVADYVTFHFIYPHEHNVTTNGNSSSNVNYLQIAEDLTHKYTSNKTIDNCKVEKYALPASYRHLHNLPYPINVCRNVARLSATTYFVLASDIELYPSANVINLFLNYTKKHGVLNRTISNDVRFTPKIPTGMGTFSVASLFGANTAPASPAKSSIRKMKKVFVLPIFEVDKNAKRVPVAKSDLVQMYRERKAVYFHKNVCSFCNIIPRLNKWLTSRTPTNSLDVFMTVKRHRPFNRWEPIYIGTNDEPLFDERFTWEGQQDKMTQMYELCLLNYDLAILNSAFLVHRPGIKTKNVTEYKVKASFIAHNNKVYKKAIRELEKKYGVNPWCK